MSKQHIRFARFLVLIISTVLLIVLNTVNVQPQTNKRCFSETGHCISGRILEFWAQNGGASIFGYPLGPLQEEFIEGKRLKVQWFEHSRLDLHPGNPRPKDILVGRLGIEQLESSNRDVVILPGVDQPKKGCQFFEDTGYNLCPPFLKYWKNNGIELSGVSGTSDEESLALFGKPISKVKIETIDSKSYTVQWFERARLQYLSENQPPEILLGALGSELFPLMPATDKPPIPRVDPGTTSFDPNIPPPPRIAPILIPNEKPKEPTRAALKITNNTGDKLRFTLLGPTNTTFPLANRQTLKVNIDPGTYQSRIAASCEVKTKTFTIQAGQVNEINVPPCVVVRTEKTIIRIVNNNDDRARFILKGPTSDNWFVRAGQTIQQEIIPGAYESTLANSCGSSSKNFTIADGETLELIFKKCGKARIKFVNNDIDIKLEVRGPTSGNWSVSSGQIFEQEVFSGDYQITAVTVCGSNTESYTIKPRQILTITSKCVPSVVNFINKGEGAVRVTLNGPTSDTWSVPKGETIEKTVSPGDYKITASDACGSDTASFTIAAGQRKDFTSTCIIGTIPVAKIEVKNDTGATLRLGLTGPKSYNWSVGNGQTLEQKIVPGTYRMNVNARCGSQVENFTVGDGESHSVSYFCG